MNDDQFADTFKPAPNAAMCNIPGGRYHRSTKVLQETQDFSTSIEVDGIEMYALFCGFKNGGDLARFALNRMVYELFGDQPINKNCSPETICDVLHEKFMSVDRRCFQEVEEHLTQIFICQEMEPRDENKISELENKVRAGCTALVVLRIQDDLYVLNCGTSQALVLTDSQTNPEVRLLARPHDNENPEEIRRLEQLNIDPMDVSAPTRALGDSFRRQKYDEDPAFKKAKGPPVIPEPEIVHVRIEQGWKHLILVSGGTIQNIKDCEVEDIPSEIREQFTEEFTVPATASTLVFKVGRKHKDAYDKHVKDNPQLSASNHCEEMSVIYVKLHEGLINTIYDSIGSIGGIIITEPEIFEPYVDLIHKDYPELDKFLVIP